MPSRGHGGLWRGGLGLAGSSTGGCSLLGRDHARAVRPQPTSASVGSVPCELAARQARRAAASCGSAVTFSVDYLKAEAEIMLQFLPQVAAVLNAKGKAPIFSSECSATVGYRCDCCRDRDRCCEQW